VLRDRDVRERWAVVSTVTAREFLGPFSKETRQTDRQTDRQRKETQPAPVGDQQPDLKPHQEGRACEETTQRTDKKKNRQPDK
jgi:hypothetical protein